MKQMIQRAAAWRGDQARIDKTAHLVDERVELADGGTRLAGLNPIEHVIPQGGLPPPSPPGLSIATRVYEGRTEMSTPYARTVHNAAKPLLFSGNEPLCPI